MNFRCIQRDVSNTIFHCQVSFSFAAKAVTLCYHCTSTVIMIEHIYFHFFIICKNVHTRRARPNTHCLLVWQAVLVNLSHLTGMGIVVPTLQPEFCQLQSIRLNLYCNYVTTCRLYFECNAKIIGLGHLMLHVTRICSCVFHSSVGLPAVYH